MWGLFIFGTYNCDKTLLLRDIYPYIIFLWLNILEKKAMHFLQGKQKLQIEKGFQLISIRRVSGKMHTIKLSNDFEKNDVLRNLNKVYKLAPQSQATPKNKLQQQGSLPLEALHFDKNTNPRDYPSKSFDVNRMKSIKKPIPFITFELEGIQLKSNPKSSEREGKEEEEEKSMNIPKEHTLIFEKNNEECDIYLQTSNLHSLKIDRHFEMKEITQPLLKCSFISHANKHAYKLQNFYKNKKAYLKYEIMLGSQYFLIRIFLIIFLVNSNLTNSIFAILYLVIILVICFRKSQALINFIKNFTLVIIPIHYLFFLVNINQETSPRTLPLDISSFQDISLIHYLFGDESYKENADLLRFLGLGLENLDFSSFILVSLIICFLQIYFMYYFTLAEYIIKSIDKRYWKFEQALEDRESQLINYKKWKKPEYRFLNQFYNFLHIGIHLVIICFMCLFTIIDFSLPNFFLFLLFMIYIILCELGFFSYCF